MKRATEPDGKGDSKDKNEEGDARRERERRAQEKETLKCINKVFVCKMGNSQYNEYIGCMLFSSVCISVAAFFYIFSSSYFLHRYKNVYEFSGFRFFFSLASF